MVLFPKLIYRKYRGAELLDELVQNIKMRCYYPAEFRALIERQGFKIDQTWGGYEGQEYGKGPELVIKFRSE